jgi:hypothetical protein
VRRVVLVLVSLGRYFSVEGSVDSTPRPPPTGLQRGRPGAADERVAAACRWVIDRGCLG